MFEVQISTENVIKSVMAWSALDNQMRSDRGLLGVTAVKGLEVIMKDEAEMLAAGLYPLIERFDDKTLTFTVSDGAGVSNVTMLKLLTLFERAVAYGVLRYLNDNDDSTEGRMFVELRRDAMGAIRTILGANSSTDIKPWRW